MKKIYILLLLSLSFSIKLYGEGSREMLANVAPADRATNWTALNIGEGTYGNFASPGGTRLNIYLRPGETLRMAFLNMVGGTNQYTLRAPDGTIVQGPAVTVTEYATIDEIMIGPSSIYLGGYDVTDVNALNYTVPGGGQEGNYYIEFTGTGTNARIEYWDFTVESAVGEDMRGRVWSENWALRQDGLGNTGDPNDDSRAFSGAFYAYATNYDGAPDGFVSEIDFNNSLFRPWAFNIAFNDEGPEIAGQEKWQSSESSNTNQTNPKYPVFLNDPDPSIWPSGTFGGFTGFTPKLARCGEEDFSLVVETTQAGYIQVLMDLDGGDGLYTENTRDRYITYNIIPGVDGAGMSAPFRVAIPWDGRDGLGDLVDTSVPLDVDIYYADGSCHFPIFDAEFMTNGMTVSNARPIPPGAYNLLTFWDDSQITSGNSTPGGGADKIELNGADQATKKHTWQNYTDNFTDGYGNRNTINTFWYAYREQNSETELEIPRLVLSAGNDQTLCFDGTGNQTITLSASNSGTSGTTDQEISWSGGAGTISNSGSYTTDYTLDASELTNGNVITLEVALAGCPTSTSDDVNVTVLDDPEDDVAPIGDNVFLGDGGTITVPGTVAGYTYQAFDITGSTTKSAQVVSPANGDLEIPIPSAELTPPGTYEFLIKASNGSCVVDVRNPATIQVLNAGTHVVVPGTQEACIDTDLLLDAASISLIAILDSDGDDQSLTITVTNGILDLVDVATSITINNDGTNSITASGSITAVNQALDGAVFTPTLGFSGTATIEVSTDDGNGNSDTKSFDISVSPYPTPVITPSAVTIAPGLSTALTASGGGTYLWSTGATGTSITVTPPTTTTYSVTVTTAGCASTTNATVTVAAEICNNGIDDDGDGFIDCYDSDCFTSGDCGRPAAVCTAPLPPAAEFNIQLQCFAEDQTYVIGAESYVFDPSGYDTPKVGDVDNDGQIEILVTSDDGPDRGVFIFDASDCSFEGIIPVNLSNRNGGVSVANVDGDPFLEVFVSSGDAGPGDNTLRRFDFDGTTWIPTWNRTDVFHFRGFPPDIIDFNEDGTPELIIYTERSGNKFAAVLNINTGATLVNLTASSTGTTANTELNDRLYWKDVYAYADVIPAGFDAGSGPVPYADGVELITGNRVYTVDIATGNYYDVWGAEQTDAPVAGTDIGHNAWAGANNTGGVNNTTDGGSGQKVSLADINKDGDLDVVVVGQGRLSVWDPLTNTRLYNTYELAGSVSTTQGGNSGKGGIAVIGDVDGDGYPEMGVVSSIHTGSGGNPQQGAVEVVEVDGNGTGSTLVQKWSVENTDGSGETGLTFFDFEGDGNVEMVYRDLSDLNIFNGASGTVEFTQGNCSSNTGGEHPIVADVDNDFRAEIVVACDQGMRVYRDQLTPWISARETFNQRAYNIVNINDDLTVPQVMQDNHTVSYMNNYLTQIFVYDENNRPFYPAPDITIEIEDLSSDVILSTNCSNTVEVRLRVCNEGDVAVVDYEVPISFYNEDPRTSTGARYIKTENVQFDLQPGQCIKTTPIELDLADIVNSNGTNDGVFFFTVNDNGTGNTGTALASGVTVTNLTLPNSPFPECDYDNNFYGPIEIVDCSLNDLVTITANDPDGNDTNGSPDDGQFTITLSNASTSSATVVVFQISGSASPSVDYAAISAGVTGSVTILANSTTATVDVDVTGDLILEGNETVILTLISVDNGYNIGGPSEATVTIVDGSNDPPVAADVTNSGVLGTIFFNSGATLIDPLDGTDPNTPPAAGSTITSFVITSLPPNGTLIYNGIPVIVGQSIPIGGADDLFFNPDGTNPPVTQTFQYYAVDDLGAFDPSLLATYTIPFNNFPPTTNNETHTPTIDVTDGATNLDNFSGADVDGTVVGYEITSIPSTGTLYYVDGGATITITSSVTLTLAQANNVFYIPDPAFTGDQTTFQVAAIDDFGDTDATPATYTIPLNTTPELTLDANNSDGDAPNHETTFTQGGSPVAVADGDGAVTDANDTDADQLTITAATVLDAGSEVLTIGGTSFTLGVTNTTVVVNVSGNNFAIAYVAATGVFTITQNGVGDMPLNDLNDLINSITYSNTSTTPDYTPRPITFVANDGITPSNTATATINIVCTITASITGTNEICDGASTTLTALGTGADTYLWSTGETTPSIVVAPNTTLTYSVTVTNSVGACSSQASQTVTVNPLPAVTATASSASICVGQSVTLTAMGADTYTWMPGSLSGAVVSVSPAANQTYTVTGEDTNGCSATATVSITVNPTPTIAAVSVDDTCEGLSVTVNLSGMPTTGTYEVTYVVTGANSVGPATATVTPDGSGNASFTMTGTSFTNTGSNTIEIQSVRNTSTNCTISPAGITNTFETLNEVQPGDIIISN